MINLIQENKFTPSVLQLHYETMINRINRQPTVPVQSLEEALIELGQTSNNKGINRIVHYYIRSKQPNLTTKVKFFFSKKWEITKAYPQLGANKIKNIFYSIYHHPTVPYIGAGLAGTATALLIGVSIPAGFMLGVVVKLGSMGIDKGLDAINRSINHRAFNWIKGSKSEVENISQSSLNQTMRSVPIAILSFSLGLHSYHLALITKIATAAAVIGLGAFLIGSNTHTQ